MHDKVCAGRRSQRGDIPLNAVDAESGNGVLHMAAANVCGEWTWWWVFLYIMGRREKKRPRRKLIVYYTDVINSLLEILPSVGRDSGQVFGIGWCLR